MLANIRLKLTNSWVAAVGIFGVGLLPCPDCAIPLAVHIWPVAGVVWLYRRFRRRSVNRLDLLLSDDLQSRAGEAPSGDPSRPA